MQLRFLKNQQIGGRSKGYDLFTALPVEIITKKALLLGVILIFNEG